MMNKRINLLMNHWVHMQYERSSYDEKKANIVAYEKDAMRMTSNVKEGDEKYDN